MREGGPCCESMEHSIAKCGDADENIFFRAVMDRILFESVDKLQPVSYEVCDVLVRLGAWSA